MKPLLFRDLAVTPIPIPPVTGLNNNNRPYANTFDGSRTFRDRTYSQKRRRGDGQDELLDSVFDLTHDYPPLVNPDKPAVDVASIKTVLVEATAMAENLKPMLNRDDFSQDSKAIVTMLMTLVNLVGAVVERGIEPLSTAVVGGGATTSRGFAKAARNLANPPPTAPRFVPGKKELVEALKRADTESVLFGANLGATGVAHRGTLNASFTADLKRRTVEMAVGQPSAVLEESLRVVEDALSCVENIEFLGQRSKIYKPPGDGGETDFCSIPIRLVFPDKDTRMNFERTIKANTGLKVSQSLPPVLRGQMAAFRRALEGKYGGDMIMTRPDPHRLEFIAFRRDGGGGKWEQLPDTYQIPPQCMLPGYKVPGAITLPEGVVAVGDQTGGGDMAVG
jgi:hypothetical protein